MTPSLLGSLGAIPSEEVLAAGAGTGREHGWNFSLVGWLLKPLHSSCPAKVTPEQPGALPQQNREAGVNPEQAGKEGREGNSEGNFWWMLCEEGSLLVTASCG